MFRKYFQGEMEYALSDIIKEMEKIILMKSESSLYLGWGINIEIPKNVKE